MLKFFELNRRFEKCFCKTDSSTLAKLQQVSVRGDRSSEKSVGTFVKFEFSLKTSENMFVRRNILSFFFPNLKNWKMFRENMHLFVQENMNRLSGLWVVYPSKVSENLVKFNFSRQWLKLRISDVIMLKFFELNRRFEKCIGKYRQFNFSKTATGLCMRGNRSSDEKFRKFR